MRERGIVWAYGADELYMRAGLELPPASMYDGFTQVENGVGAVRWLQQQIAEGAEGLRGWEGRRIGVLTGTAMAPLMPQVLEPLRAATGATLELIPVTNTLFGASVTTAGLLPGSDMLEALKGRDDLDLVQARRTRAPPAPSRSLMSRSTSSSSSWPTAPRRTPTRAPRPT